MNENPYQSPQSPGKKLAEAKPTTWHPLTWTIIGFCGGTSLVAPFVLSLNMPTRIQGGMIYGGITGAIWGLAYGISRRRGAAQPGRSLPDRLTLPDDLQQP